MTNSQGTQSAATVNPLFTLAEFNRLKEAQRQATSTLELIDKLEACGQLCDELKAMQQFVLTRLSKLEAEFFNPPPMR